MEPKKRITLKELTALTGLSRTTLYNILNEKGNFSEETRRRVMQAMEEYDYRPNLNARNLARRCSIVVAYVGIRSDLQPYYNRAVQAGLSRALRRYEDHGLSLLNRTCPVEDEAGFLHTLEELEQAGTRNFILFARISEPVRTAARRLIEHGCTVVFLSNHLRVEGALGYAGCAYRQSGQICAELARKFSAPSDSILPITSKTISMDAAVAGRLSAFREALQQTDRVCRSPLYCNVTPLSDAVLDEKIRDAGVTVVADILGDITFVCDYLTRRGLDQQVRVLCFDVHEEIVPYLQSGCIDAVIHQSLENEAYQATKMLFEAVCYHKPPEPAEYYAPLEIVLDSNLNYYYSNG